MGKYKNIQGLKYSRLTVIKYLGIRSKAASWLCRCDCGNEKEILGYHLRNGTTQSCGCLQVEHGKSTKTHGESNTTEYQAWHNMKDRCLRENHKQFSEYGGRGITVCDRWINSFENFIYDMGKKPTPSHSLDRFPDVNGNYCPENCRWATSKQQNGNRRDNVWYEYNGERMITSLWAQRLGVDVANFSNMINRKSFEQAYIYYSTVGKPGNLSTGMANAKKVGKFDSEGNLIREYFPFSSVIEDGYRTRGLFESIKLNRQYRGYNWKYI